MSIPNLDHACWARLIGGQLPQFKTQHAALMFLLKKQQGSTDALMERKKALYDFFAKYERVLDSEIKQLTH